MVKSLIKVAIGVGALYVAKKVVYDKIVNPAIQDFNKQLDDINGAVDSFNDTSLFMDKINEELVNNSNYMFEQAVAITNQAIEENQKNMEQIIQQHQNDAMFMQQMQQPIMF